MLIYVYSGSEDGFFTAIHRIYCNRKVPDEITSAQNYEYCLDSAVVRVADDYAAANIIRDCLSRRIGKTGLDRIRTALAYGGADKEMIIFRYIRLVFKFGKQCDSFKNDLRVIAFDDIFSKVVSEAHNFKGFMRFSELSNGIMYAEYEPDNDITAQLLDFFADKFSGLQLLIRDAGRGLLGMYNGTEKRIAHVKNDFQPVYAEDEILFKNMWHAYFNSVNIKQRTNRRLQDRYMPRRYRKNMHETFPALSHKQREPGADLFE